MPEDTDTQPTETEAPQPAPAFTQADIDRIVKERIERVKARYADYDDLKARAARLDEIERAQMDEKERLAADLKALEDKVSAAERARDEALAQSQERLLRAEVTALAAAMSFKYPGDIFRLADLSAAAIDESGAVVGVREALEALAKERPDYIAKPAAPRIDGEARGQESDLPKLTPAQERAAKALGVSPEAYAKRLSQA